MNAHNSKHELSIEKFLQKSEEAFFDKVKKDKLSSAASIRSSQRDSIWGAPSSLSYDHSRPQCEYCHRCFAALHLRHFVSAPSHSAFAPGDGYSGPLPNDNGDVVVMTGLQIAMAREIGGWPLYTIIIAAGQV